MRQEAVSGICAQLATSFRERGTTVLGHGDQGQHQFSSQNCPTHYCYLCRFENGETFWGTVPLAVILQMMGPLPSQSPCAQG